VSACNSSSVFKGCHWWWGAGKSSELLAHSSYNTGPYKSKESPGICWKYANSYLAHGPFFCGPRVLPDRLRRALPVCLGAAFEGVYPLVKPSAHSDHSSIFAWALVCPSIDIYFRRRRFLPICCVHHMALISSFTRELSARPNLLTPATAGTDAGFLYFF
jgi:hypothetical protein